MGVQVEVGIVSPVECVEGSDHRGRVIVAKITVAGAGETGGVEHPAERHCCEVLAWRLKGYEMVNLRG